MGRSRLKVFVGLLVFVALFVAAIRIVPVYVKAYAFRDAMRTEARLFPAAWPVRTTQQVEKELYVEAENLGLPIGRNQIEVVKTPGGIGITARFTVRVNLIVLEHNFDFVFRTTTQKALGN